MNRTAVLFVVGGLVAACGPTAQVTTRPTPSPVAMSSPATGSLEPTPIPLSTPTAVAETPAPTITTGPGSDIFQALAFPAADAYEVTAVTSTPDGFVAVGFGGLSGDGYFGVRQGIVWRSADGVTWQKSVDPAFQYITPAHIASVGTDVYVLGSLSTCGQIIETECTDVPEVGNMFLRSSGGGPWERLAQAPDMQAAILDEMIAFGGGLAVGGTAYDDQETTTLWRSPDGATWTSTSDVAGMDPISALAPSGSGLVGFGTRYVPEIDDTQLVAATSADGVSFTAATVANVPSATVADLIAGPSGFAAVGYGASDVAATIGLAMFSTDGNAWVQTGAPDGSFAGTLLSDVHSSSAEYVAVGFAPGAEDFTLQAGRVWVSADGQAWRMLGQFGEAFSQFGASALGPAGLLIFTADQEDVGDDVNVNSTINAWFAPVDKLAP